jgi:predicted DNA binding CopG/RHH family protein
MATEYNQIGSLTELLSKCRCDGVEFNTFEEIIDFLNSYDKSLSCVSNKAKDDLDKEIETTRKELDSAQVDYEQKRKTICELLDKNIQDLNLTISSNQVTSNNPFVSLFRKTKVYILAKKRKNLENSYEMEKGRHLRVASQRINQTKEELSYKKNNYEKLIRELADKYASELNLINKTLRENSPLLYGARGEYMAEKELEKLPNTYSLINNVCFQFPRGIHDRKNDDWIYSAQIDHVVVGPTGVFLIETKNWSQESATNEALFSPVKQINRTGHSVYIALKNAVEMGRISGFGGEWGEQKIPLRKIILLTGYRPRGEYDFVKLLKLHEVRAYITYGKVLLNEEQIKNLVDYFTHVN